MPVRVQHEDFDASAEISRLRASYPAAGAVASFIGIVRDQNDAAQVSAISIEHYPGMTEKSLASIADDAKSRWKLLDVLIVHRIGTLVPGDQIVLVATSSLHRADAFSACQFVMDHLKTDAPFWKKETTIGAGTRWVDARASDATARDRWER